MKKYWSLILSLVLIGSFQFYSNNLLAQKPITVHVFIAEECPICIYMARPLKVTREEYSENVRFVAVFPKENSTQESAQRFIETYQLHDFEIKLDNDQSFTRSMGATVTPEAVITNENGEILYRGRISDAYNAPGRMKHGPRKNELNEKLAMILDSQSIEKPWADAVGCYITFHHAGTN